MLSTTTTTSVVLVLLPVLQLARCVPAPYVLLDTPTNTMPPAHRRDVLLLGYGPTTGTETTRFSLLTSTANTASASSPSSINAAQEPITTSTSSIVSSASSFSLSEYTSTPTANPSSPSLMTASPGPTSLSNPSFDQQQQAHFSDADDPKPLVMGYYPDWAGSTLAPEHVDFKRYDWIDFAFAIPNEHFELTWEDPSASPALLRRLVDSAHNAGKKVKLSIGGATGSKYFSPAVASPSNRRTFADNLLAMLVEFGLDGIDIDWEYPGFSGYPGNIVSPSDTGNFLLFLQLLRTTLPSSARITAATQPTTFVDSNKEPMKDMSAFASVLDWILIMNYDVWGSSNTPGPNAPMYDSCHNSTQPEANAVAAYDAWTTAGFPGSKIVLGLPSYAYVSQSTASGLRQRRSRFEARAQDNAVIVKPEDGGEGQVQFVELVRQGALLRNATSIDSFIGAGGFTRYWDSCSSTPYLRSASQMISFDDPESLRMKAEFVKRMGMLGTNLFDVHGDTDSYDLIDGVRRGLGL